MYPWVDFSTQAPYHVKQIIITIISGLDQTRLRAWCSAENLSQTTLHYSRAAICCVSHLKEALKEMMHLSGKRTTSRTELCMCSDQWRCISSKQAWHQVSSCGQSCSNLDPFKRGDSFQSVQLVCTQNSGTLPVCGNIELEKKQLIAYVRICTCEMYDIFHEAQKKEINKQRPWALTQLFKSTELMCKTLVLFLMP